VRLVALAMVAVALLTARVLGRYQARGRTRGRLRVRRRERRTLGGCRRQLRRLQGEIAWSYPQIEGAVAPDLRLRRPARQCRGRIAHGTARSRPGRGRCVAQAALDRYYDPTTGTFLSRDPLDGASATPDESNPYDYVGNDPLNFSDPSGLRRLGDCALGRENGASSEVVCLRITLDGRASIRPWDGRSPGRQGARPSVYEPHPFERRTSCPSSGEAPLVRESGRGRAVPGRVRLDTISGPVEGAVVALTLAACGAQDEQPAAETRGTERKTQTSPKAATTTTQLPSDEPTLGLAEMPYQRGYGTVRQTRLVHAAVAR
jgi:hypothetical protein